MIPLTIRTQGLRCLALILALAANPGEAFRELKDLPVPETPPGLTLDLYLPDQPEEALACILVIQGGGFRSRSGEGFRDFARYFSGEGFAAALVSYRGLPEHTWRETLSDVRAARDFIRRHGQSYGIDPARMGAFGGSAGATLALLLALTDEPDSPKETRGGNLRAAVGYAGVYDFITRFTDPGERMLQPRLEEKRLSNEKWIGVPFSDENKEWREASAVHHVDPADPPCLLLHARDDAVVPWTQTRGLARALSEAEVPVEVRYYPEGGHGFWNRMEPLHLETVSAFFRETLASDPTCQATFQSPGRDIPSGTDPTPKP